MVQVEKLFAQWIAGVSVQDTIFVKQGIEPTERFLAHEYTHTLQWRRYGTIGFLTRYFGLMPWLVVSGKDFYLDHPLENEAEKYENNL